MQEAEEKKHRKEEEKAAKEAAIQLQNEINLVNQDKKNIKKPSTAEEIEDINKKSKEEVEEAHVMLHFYLVVEPEKRAVGESGRRMNVYGIPNRIFALESSLHLSRGT
ncbi:uncharacterized protein ATNIH1004_005401 [Aspergillus tanneri]|uniref:Uncharacterized protein n=1 Tax=Aspergillus tanneri TaxID=1220188 RepID=A0A5M9MLE3_9EURO|nr:uncharacterized protein ATNIH1004_005401 [Aspergillus tanneri]KAA8646726.1 hypothetical protein ATNIH1004_005401 [Aspergillus tanneri]